MRHMKIKKILIKIKIIVMDLIHEYLQCHKILQEMSHADSCTFVNFRRYLQEMQLHHLPPTL